MNCFSDGDGKSRGNEFLLFDSLEKVRAVFRERWDIDEMIIEDVSVNEAVRAPGVPMWVSHEAVQKGFYQLSNARATKAGLVLRAPLATFLETKQAFYKYHSNYDFKDASLLC